MKALKRIMMVFALVATMNRGRAQTAASAPETVDVTVYTPHCGNGRGVTASGRRINKRDPYSHRWIALSRDLLRRFPMGSRVALANAGLYSGFYTVQDLMASRWKRRVDVLVGDRNARVSLAGALLIPAASLPLMHLPF